MPKAKGVITVSIPQKWHVIECERCGCKFVLFAILDEHEHEEDEENGYYLAQAHCNYCPYCGYEDRGDKS